MPELSDFIFDTREYPSTEENDALNKLKKLKSWERPKSRLEGEDKKFSSLLCSLARDGHVSTYQLGNSVYFYVERIPETRPRTVRFYIPQLKINKRDRVLLKEEEGKLKAMRAFIAKWILKRTSGPKAMTDEEYKKFIVVHIKAAAIVLSFPAFLENQFQEDAKQADLDPKTLTPHYRIFSCRYCGEKFEEMEDNGAVECPKCGETAHTK
ncbi:MAG: hypothetical protein WBC74_01135 [Candidatus Omnitrophota bacterium]